MEMTILTNEEMMMIDGGINWGQVATGLTALSGLVLAVACAPALPVVAGVLLCVTSGSLGVVIGDGIVN